MTFFHRLLLVALAPVGAAWSQIAVLDNFNNPGATGSIITNPATSWIGNVTRNAATITVGGTARNDNGWGAIGQNINASSMTHLSVIAQRDSGHVETNILVVELQDAALSTHQITIPTSSFAMGTLTTVSVPIGTWPSGFNSAQITGWTMGGGTAPTGLTAFRMTFDNLSLTGGTPPAAPTITQQPPNRAIGVGTGTTMTVAANANNSGALRYQWRKGSTAIPNATTATLSFSNTTVDQTGTYFVDVTNDAGTTPSNAATLTVLDARPTHAIAPGTPGYVSGGTVSIANTLTYTGTATQVRWSAMLPTGWTLASDTATTASTRPNAGTHTLVEWTWTTVPGTPLTFTYTLNVPIGTEGDRTITSLVAFSQGGVTGDIIPKPDPLLVVNVNSRHSADTDADFRISLTELTRVIELYNTRNGTVRTGAYNLSATGTEDGFAPDPARADTAATLSRYHASDVGRDGRIDLVELMRVIAFYNTRDGAVRTGFYHRDASTEDGFAPGP